MGCKYIFHFNNKTTKNQQNTKYKMKYRKIILEKMYS